MIPAAVGFQCPECVASGLKQTRQNQGPYGGVRSKNPSLTTIVLIVINVVIWGFGMLQRRVIDVLTLTPYGVCMAGDGAHFYPNATAADCATLPGAFWDPGVATGGFWQVLTSGFVHEELMHLGFNMIALWFLAPMLERVLGRTRLLAVYLLSIVSGSALVLWLSEPYAGTLGASGGVFGLLGALLLLAWRLRGNVRPILIWLGANLLFTFMGPLLGTAISWEGHVGGLLGGLAATAIVMFAPKPKREFYQILGLAGLTILLLALITLRVFMLAG